ncbi:MAG: hypothetical protein N4A35_16905 [Flavobacteriales bacterium]|jgi:hypothetical protein|nr:hypothetical protein [Flavobacteriales bacterium]
MLKQKIVNILFINLAFILFLSCNAGLGNKKNTTSTSEVIIKKTDTIITKNGKHLLIIEAIDSLHFFSTKAKSGYKNDDFLKITDFYEAKKRLKNIAEFDDTAMEPPVVLKLRDRRNRTIKIDDYYAFVAYYPEEDILLCEGGHSIDVSFNLKNGERTVQTGNPEVIKSSPTKKYRLNGHFGGQQCYTYFIQERFDKSFKKVVLLGEAFEKTTNRSLCVIGDAFWINDHVLYLAEDSNFGVDIKYFKIEMIKKQ